MILDVIARVVMATIGSAVAKKYNTRERASKWFDSLGIDWIMGIGLALVIVLLPIVLVMMAANR